MLQANVRLIAEGHLREARLNSSKLRRTSTVIRNAYGIVYQYVMSCMVQE